MRRITRLGAYVASACLALGGASLLGQPAQAVPSNNPVGLDYGAAWLSAQLTNGLVHNPNFGGFDDYGLTVDIGMALQGEGSHGTVVQSITDALAQHVDDYVTPFGGPHSYTGSLAKLAAFVGDPADTSFGGQNLISRLESRVYTAAPVAGRIHDVGFKPGDQFDDDAANVLGQAYAVHALAAASSPRTADARGFLLQQQCPGGGFRLDFTKDKSAAQQGCTTNADQQIDVTAIVVSQLQDLSGNAAVASALTQARSWLAAQQNADGSWGGGVGTSPANANSTGLAAVAIGGVPANATAVGKAATWLRDHQVTYYDVCDALLSQRGAIAYDDQALLEGRSHGITSTSTSQDQWRRASAQAVLALQYLPQDFTPTDPVMTGPSGWLKQGAHPVLTISGINAGDKLCLNGTNLRRQFTATGSTSEQAVTLPDGTATRSYAVRDPEGHASVVRLSVLGAKQLLVSRTPGTVHRSSTITVAVRGLEPQEPGRIYYGTRLVRSGAASDAGNLVARFDSGTVLGTQSIRGYGRFADIRRGATTVTVVR